MDELIENAVLEWSADELQPKYVERILWIDPVRDKVITISLEDEKAIPQSKTLSEMISGVQSKRCKPIVWVDNRIPMILDEKIAPKSLEIRDKAWDAIQLIVSEEPDCYDSRLRGAMIQEANERTGLHKSTIYRYLRRYWQGGKLKNALLPFYENCGGSGEERKSGEVKRGRPRKYADQSAGINADEEIRQLFRSGIQLFYNTKDKAPLKRAYQLTIQKFFTSGYRYDGENKIPMLLPPDRLPTFTQFKYWFRKESDLQESLIKRYGKNKFNQNSRPILGSSTYESFGPGSRYQIDATIADVYLVSEYRREWIIGRPVIYVVIDVFSRLITGIYIGLEGPSWIGAMMALANTTEDKLHFCSEYGIEIDPEEWICSHLPQKLTADRGELEGHKPNNLIDVLGVDVENAAPYRADWKGIVEQQFRLLNLRTIHFVPGAVKERMRERGERDYRLDAKLTLREFTQIIIKSVIYHNNHHYMSWYDRSEFMIAEDVSPIPRELWLWGIKNRTGRLRKMPEEIVKLNLLYQGEATVTGLGIQFKGMYYSCDHALKEQWFIRARTGRSWRVKVSYDPRTANHIYLWLDKGHSFEVCTLLEREERYRDKRFEEIDDLLALERQQVREQETIRLQPLSELEAYTQSIIQQAEIKTNEALKKTDTSKRDRIKGIKQNRKLEKEAHRVSEAFQLGETDKILSGAKAKLVPMSTTSDSVSTENRKEGSTSDKLAKIREYLVEEGDED